MWRTLTAMLAYVGLAVSTVKEDLLVSMRNEQSRVSVVMPPNTASLLSHMNTTHSYRMGAASAENLDAMIQSWKLPEDISAMFAQSAFALTEQFQTFTFNVAPSYSYYEQWIGATKNVDYVVTITYMHVVATATPITQKQLITTRSCHKCYLFFTCCSSASAWVSRGYVKTEIETMMTALRALAFDRLSADFPTTAFLNYRDVLELEATY